MEQSFGVYTPRTALVLRALRAEVNGKSTTGGSFGKLLPATATAEIRLRLIRVQVVDLGHLHLPLRAISIFPPPRTQD